MNVDESRGDDQASSIDHPDGPSSFGSSELADSGDRILVDGDVGGESGSPGAINHFSIDNDQVEFAGRGLAGRAGAQDKQENDSGHAWIVPTEGVASKP